MLYKFNDNIFTFWKTIGFELLKSSTPIRSASIGGWLLFWYSFEAQNQAMLQISYYIISRLFVLITINNHLIAINRCIDFDFSMQKVFAAPEELTIFASLCSRHRSIASLPFRVLFSGFPSLFKRTVSSTIKREKRMKVFLNVRINFIDGGLPYRWRIFGVLKVTWLCCGKAVLCGQITDQYRHYLMYSATAAWIPSRPWNPLLRIVPSGPMSMRWGMPSMP